MRFTINITAEDLAAFVRHHVATSPRVRRVRLISSLIFPVIWVAIAASKYSRGDQIGAAIWLGAAVLWLVLFPLYTRWNSKRALGRLFRKGNYSAYAGDHEVALEDNLIKCKYPGGYAETKMSSIQKVVETDDYIFLYNTPVSAITFPKRCLSPEVQQALKAVAPAA